MSKQYKCGLSLTCSGCLQHQNVYTPDHSQAEAFLLLGLMDGTSPMYVVPPGPDSTIGKSNCCGKPVKGVLFGY